MTDKNRPLSPHIQIYKPQITSLTSILHRLSGVALYLGVVLLCILISYYTYQVDVTSGGYECDCTLTKTLIYIALFLWSLALYYHLCNGIRHLFWDIGKGFEIKTAKKTGLIVLITSLSLSILSFGFIYLMTSIEIIG